MVCRVWVSLYRSSLSSCMAKRPHRGWLIARSQHPPMPDRYVGLKVDYRFVVLVLTDDFCGSVCRVIVHDDDVEWKACFLCECRPDGIVNGTGAIAHGDDDGGFIFEISFLYIRFHTYGSRRALIDFKYRVNASSISICTSLLRGFT